MTYFQKLEKKWNQGKFLSVGLDPEIEKIPEVCKKSISLTEQIFDFNKTIIDSTAEYVCTFKPNSAFYEAYGAEGIDALKRTCTYIYSTYPEVLILLDAKRGDIGSTNNGYVKYAFDYLGVDAITLHPYLGAESLKSFLERADKGLFILAKTSNPGAGEFQDLDIKGIKFYEHVVKEVAAKWNRNNNCAFVVGATYPDEMLSVRAIIGDMPILIPGIGAQGGDLDASVLAGKNSKNQGFIISSSRGIIYASKNDDFAEKAVVEAKKIHDTIQKVLAL